MSLLKNKIKQLVKDSHQEVVANRRYLHSNPELSFKEFETSKFIQQKLDAMGIPYQSGFVGTGVVGELKGNLPNSRCIALRADIDALPIFEKNRVDYCSQNDGVMHACGHDVHTASLLGVAKILNETKNDWNGTIKLIFQPGEEKLPGGASLMIQEGVLDSPKVEKIIGQHVSPELPTGVIGMRPGMFMASSDEVYITVSGKGGHAALPKGTVNPIVVASKLVLDLYNRFDQEKDSPTIFSLGVVNGGTAGNIIPDEVQLAGTFRAMDENWRSKAHVIMREICDDVALKYTAICDLEIKVGYPFLKNDDNLTESCFNMAQSMISEDKVIEIPARMTSEDFSYYSQHVPACFYRLGVGFDGQTTRGLHTSKFDINEDALLTSVEVMTWMAINC
jgi:amidohydrolase